MLKNVSLQLRIVCAAGVPLLVAVYFMGATVIQKYDTGQEMKQAESLAQLASTISALVHETQKERGATGVFMGSGGKRFASELAQQRDTADSRRTALKEYLETCDTSALGEEFNETLSIAVARMNQLDDYRSEASSLSVPTGQVLGSYTQHNARMLDVIQEIAACNKNAEMARISSAYSNFLQGKERAGIERAVMSNTFGQDMFGAGVLRKFGALVTAQDTYFDSFLAQATPEQVAFYEQRLSDPVVAEVQRMRDIAFKKGEVKTDGFGVEASHWFDTITQKINLMKQTEDRLASDLKAMSQNEFGGLVSLLNLSTNISDLVHEAQKERGATGVYVGSGRTKFEAELASQRKSTDTVRQALTQAVSGLARNDLDKEFIRRLDQAMAKLDEIDAHRSQVSDGGIPAGEAIGYYTKHNAVMLDTIAAVAGATDNGRVRTNLMAYVNFLQGKERAGIERAVMSKTFAADRFESGTLRKFGALVTAQDTYFASFRSLATPEQVAYYNQKLSGPVVDEVQRMRDVAFKMGSVDLDGFGIDASHWFSSMTQKINLMKEVEDRLSADLSSRASALQASAQRTVTTVGAIAAVAVIGVLVMVWLVSRSITRPFKEIFRGLKSFSAAELSDTAQTFNRVIEGMTESVAQVNDAAGQVSSSSQQLAEGASEQASSLEQTSAALEEMAAMTRTNAENSKQASNLVNETHRAAEEGNQTMTEINESSEQISKIIKVIEEIAFQTNLLALNAAVEAARAGEHGKGFAVVADEVRNLAQRAAQAARETTTLIEDSVDKARIGTEAIQGIVGSVSKVTDLVNGISQASEEQAQGVDQVNTAVSQMDRVTQQNAAGAEESASASEELSAQALTTKALVDELIVMVRGGEATSASAGQFASSTAAHPQLSRQHSSANVHGTPRTVRAPRQNTAPATVGTGDGGEFLPVAGQEEMAEF
ncbi:MAG: hypothetical protein GY842_17265 [bacterium]|nr:hypothetical protein [bacterium]